MDYRSIIKLKSVAAFGCSFILAVGTLAGCSQKEAEETVDITIEVDTTSPATSTLEMKGSFIGKVEADSTVSVIPKIPGDVLEANYEVGDRVEPGDLLFRIDDTSLRIQLSQAEAGMQTAQAAVNTAKNAVSTAEKSVSSAEASMASAEASADTARANVFLNEMNLIYTQAQIDQNLGTAETNRMQLENAVASAKYALQSAEENRELSKENFGLAEDNYRKLEDQLDDLKDDARNMEKYGDSLQETYENYKKIINTADGSSDKAYDMLTNTFGIPRDQIPGDVSGSAQKLANYYIYLMTGGSANDEYTLSVMRNSATNAASTLRSTRSSLDSNKNSMRIGMMSAAISQEAAKNGVLSAEDAKRLTEKMLEDYDKYTMAVLIAGAEYQLAGSETQMRSANNQYLQAQIGVEQANIGVDQASLGVERAAIGVEQAQAGLIQAQAALDSVNLQLGYCTVTSPVSGTIVSKNISVNNMASQAAPAYVIRSDDNQNISFNVAETVMDFINIGDEIEVERNGTVYKGIITENSGIADDATGLFRIKAQIQDSGARLIEGTSVKITLITGRVKDVMTIPADAVIYKNHTAYVYVVEDGTAHQLEISTGVDEGDLIEVKSGLKEGAVVITSWNSSLVDGSPVRER